MLTSSQLDDYQYSCQSLPHSASRAACAVMNTPNKRERHLERMADCRFRPAAMKVLQAGTAASLIALNKGQYMDGGHINSAGKPVALEVCEVSRDGGTWMFFKAGPYETTGGNLWSRLLATFNDSLTRRFAIGPHGGVQIGDHIFGNADANGRLFAYPPIHQHHYHFIHGSNMWRQSLNAHGDSECHGQQAEYCLLREYPAGIAFEAAPSLGLWVDFNDVRPASSAPLTSYVFAGIKLLQPSRFGEHQPRRIRHSYMMFYPYLGVLHDPTFNGPFATFVVNTSRASVGWTTGVIPDVDYVRSPQSPARAHD